MVCGSPKWRCPLLIHPVLRGPRGTTGWMKDTKTPSEKSDIAMNNSPLIIDVPGWKLPEGSKIGPMLMFPLGIVCWYLLCSECYLPNRRVCCCRVWVATPIKTLMVSFVGPAHHFGCPCHFPIPIFSLNIPTSSAPFPSLSAPASSKSCAM